MRTHAHTSGRLFEFVCASVKAASATLNKCALNTLAHTFSLFSSYFFLFYYADTQNTFTVLKVLALLVIIVIGLGFTTIGKLTENSRTR